MYLSLSMLCLLSWWLLPMFWSSYVQSLKSRWNQLQAVKSYLSNNFLIINVPGLNFPCVNFLKLRSCILHRDESIWLTAWTLSCTVVDCLVVRSNRCCEGLNANPGENEVGGPSSRENLFRKGQSHQNNVVTNITVAVNIDPPYFIGHLGL